MPTRGGLARGLAGEGGGELGDAGDHRHAPARRALCRLHDGDLLVARKRGVLADRAADDEAGDAVAHERVDHPRRRLDVEAVILPELGRDRREHALPPDLRRHRLKPPVSGRIVAAGDAGAKPSCRSPRVNPHEYRRRGSPLPNGRGRVARSANRVREAPFAAEPAQPSILRPVPQPCPSPVRTGGRDTSRHPGGAPRTEERLLWTARNPSPGRLRRLDLSLRGEVRACAIGRRSARPPLPFVRERSGALLLDVPEHRRRARSG